MRYHITCFEDNCQHFAIDVSPNNEGMYEITCPNGHVFKLDILSHHFQTLFENAIHALSDKYFIEAFSSFTACYERFIEYFLRIVIISRGINITEFDKTWKLLSSQSERQLGAFILTYLKEFSEQPKLLSDNLVKLRNKVIHKGYFPTEDDCIKYGNGVLNFIRPIIELLKCNKAFEDELIRSVNYTGNFENKEIKQHYFPYGVFAINRAFDKTEEKSITDFIQDQIEIKNRTWQRL